MCIVHGLTLAASIQRILNLNHVPQESELLHESNASNGVIPQSTPILNSDGEPIWKVLVFDALGRDVISSDSLACLLLLTRITAALSVFHVHPVHSE